MELSGENINITYKPDGSHIAVGNRVSSVSCLSFLQDLDLVMQPITGFRHTSLYVCVQDDELTIIDVRKFKAIHKRKFTYEVNVSVFTDTNQLLIGLLANV